MPFMICLNGDPQHLDLVHELHALGLGVELQSYGLIGIKSEAEWSKRLACHVEFLKHFRGPLAVHGPFIGMDFSPLDHVIGEAINRRMDMIYDVVRTLRIGTLEESEPSGEGCSHWVHVRQKLSAGQRDALISCALAPVL